MVGDFSIIITVITIIISTASTIHIISIVGTMSIIIIMTTSITDLNSNPSEWLHVRASVGCSDCHS